ncbi:putative transmembrane protein INAFM2 [Corythoichthys intestinalis]|uniref:putative transmembrane protein INAFM2 n=1 Tax=Corythoichthys intestinalis TaxID=161448 RepID=UPI0025A54FF7|nr:putative transmembrane protein INAFM2 [Corythoichthys intestinalis]
MKSADGGASITVDKLNAGDPKRRPSYPGEPRAKQASMSAKVWVKVAMAIAYFLCVSVAAFILVIYYVFFWTPGPHNNSTASSGGVAGSHNRTDCASKFG